MLAFWHWLAAGLPIEQTILLIAAAFVGSFMTASLGVGGGAFLLLVMAQWIPPLALIPLHGLVQLGSNGHRAWATRQHRRQDLIRAFALGALVAALLSLWWVNTWVLDWIPVLVAGFILWLSWGPLPTLGLVHSPAAIATGGFLTTLATMLFGATGPLVSAWLGRSLGDRWVYTACFSSCMSLQHLLKLGVFALLGFNFLPWLGLALAMIGAGYLGTRLGLKALHRLPETAFRRVFRWLLTALALHLLWSFFTRSV